MPRRKWRSFRKVDIARPVSSAVSFSLRNGFFRSSFTFSIINPTSIFFFRNRKATFVSECGFMIQERKGCSMILRYFSESKRFLYESKRFLFIIFAGELFSSQGFFRRTLCIFLSWIGDVDSPLTRQRLDLITCRNHLS